MKKKIVYQNNTKASEEIYEAITLTCGIDFMTLEEIDQLPEIDFNRIQFGKIFNIQHIVCVVKATISYVKNSDLAKEWITYNMELVGAIEKIIVCRECNAAKRNM